MKKTETVFSDIDFVDDPDRKVALDCIAAGIRASDPSAVIDERITLDGTVMTVSDDRYDLSEYGDVLLVGGGNAAATAAKELETVLGDRIDRGVVVTDTPVETERIEVLPADHPIPSERGVESTRTLLEMTESAGANDLVLVVVTGGGSALMPAPAAGIDLSDLQTTTDRLLTCGADISEINAVRKHCSDVKGGQLADVASPATVVGLVFSDVVGNRLDVIASGPLTADGSTFRNAIEVIDRYDIDVPDSITTRLRRGSEGRYDETPSPGDPSFESVSQYVLADGNTALRSAATVAREGGYEPLILSSRIRGESREVAKTLTGIAEECADTGIPVEPPAVLLSGGETTVTLRGDGTGGPNQEFVLGAALELTEPSIIVASVDTDGIDGVSTAAGGIATSEAITSTAEARAALQENDAGGYLDRFDGRLVTGATGTNVNDLRIFVIPET